MFLIMQLISLSLGNSLKSSRQEAIYRMYMNYRVLSVCPNEQLRA